MGLTCHYCEAEFDKEYLLSNPENPRCPGCGADAMG